jgi:sugar phosphate isomerase/epimerase
MPGDYEAVSQTGFDFAEFPCKIICQMEEITFTTLCKHIEKIGFPVLGMNMYCPPDVIIAGPGYDCGIAARYARIAAARGNALGVRVIGIGSPRSRIIPEGFDLKLAKTQLVEFLRITAGEFSVYGITVAFEALAPCFCNFINTLPEAQRVVAGAGINGLEIVADFYNMEHSGEADMDITPFIDLIGHFHISDDDGAPTKRSYLKPEKYSLHKSRIRRIKESGYNGALTLETDVAFDEVRALESLQFLKSV